MIESTDEFVFAEKYRPRKVSDTILPARLKAEFQSYVDGGSIPNMILSGRSGIGKTTIARAMLEELGCDYIVIPASLRGNIDTLRNEIFQFASTISFSGGRKYVILDEADYLNANSTQPALRNFMDEFSSNCGFILTCNFRNKLIDPLQSRCPVIDFKIDKTERVQLAKDFMNRTLKILDQENIEYEKAAVASLITKFFPDWRRVLNAVQRLGSLGKIDAGSLVDNDEVSIKVLIDYMKAKNFTEVRKWIGEHSDIETDVLYRNLYDTCSARFKPASVPQLILILAKYQYQAAFVADFEINNASCLLEIMIDCEFI